MIRWKCTTLPESDNKRGVLDSWCITNKSGDLRMAYVYGDKEGFVAHLWVVEERGTGAGRTPQEALDDALANIESDAKRKFAELNAAIDRLKAGAL